MADHTTKQGETMNPQIHTEPVTQPEPLSQQHIQPVDEKAHDEEISYTKDGTTWEQNASKTPSQSDEDGEVISKPWYVRWLRHWKHVAYAVIWLLFTGWWIASLILHRHDKNWVIPFLLYLAITLRIIFFYVPISIITRPTFYVWKRTARPFVRVIPEKLRIPAAALLTIAVILIGSFASPESADNTRDNRAVSLFGLVVCIFSLWITSRDRSRINWHTVIVGMLVQFIIALFVLRTTAGYDIFNFISMLARELLDFSTQGTDFLTTTGFAADHSGWFIPGVISAIIFFVSFVQLLYYFHIIQWFIVKFAAFFFWSMRVSGAEAVVAAASPFIGQGESAMLIKPFVAHLTMAEIHQVMCSGFATIAGSLLVSFIGMGVSSQALISSCVMSIPASLAASKLRWPETEGETITAGRVIIPEDPEEERPANALHAFANGAWMGVKIAGLMSATLLCIISLIGLIDGLLTWWGRYININEPTLTLELIVGYICYPIAFLLGVSRDGDDILKVGQLIGLKLISNEFVAYEHLQKYEEYSHLSARSRVIATYALCGFANIGSLGNQIGVLAQIAPSRAGDVSRVAISAMLTGAVSTFTSAAIAGLLITDEQQYISS